MLKQPLFLWNFGLLVLIAFLHHIAIFFYFYWTLWWFDILMHFLGGLWASSMVLMIFFGKKLHLSEKILPNKKILIVSLAGSIIIGFLWEIFEIAGQIIFLPKDLGDSSLDMVMDTLGGYFAYLNFLRYRNKRQKNAD